MIERAATENKSYTIVCVVVKSLYILRQLQSWHRLSHAINNLYTATLLALPKYIRLTVFCTILLPVPKKKHPVQKGDIFDACHGVIHQAINKKHSCNFQQTHLSRKCLWIGGFSLGFVLWCARWAGRVCTNQHQFCTTLLQRGDGAAATRSVSENSNMKFEFAVQDVIKTLNLKPPNPETLLR